MCCMVDTSLFQGFFQDQEAEHGGEQNNRFALQLGDVVPGQCRAIEALHFLDREGDQRAGADGRAIDPLQPVTVTGEEIHAPASRRSAACSSGSQSGQTAKWGGRLRSGSRSLCGAGSAMSLPMSLPQQSQITRSLINMAAPPLSWLWPAPAGCRQA